MRQMRDIERVCGGDVNAKGTASDTPKDVTTPVQELLTRGGVEPK